MEKFRKWFWVPLMIIVIISVLYGSTFIQVQAYEEGAFPMPLDAYRDGDSTVILDILINRIQIAPFNLVATLIFFLAIVHTMMTSQFHKLAHFHEEKYVQLKNEGKVDKNYQSILAGIFHLLGEVEVVFGLWAIALGIAIDIFYGWETFVHYVSDLEYKDPLFILVIMVIASSRPILKLFELFLWHVVRVFKGSLEAWWFAILVLASLLSSLITGPAAMTIASLLIAEKFYELGPSERLKYATLALLFINISIGGALTNFASPPILMVADVWNWDILFMLKSFGMNALLSISIGTTVYFFMFRKDFEMLRVPYENYRYKKYVQHRFISQKELENLFNDLEHNVDLRVGFTREFNGYAFILKESIKELARRKLTKDEIELYDIDNAIDEKFEGIKLDELRRTVPGLLTEGERPIVVDPNWDNREDPVPAWVIGVHVLFMLWTIVNAHEPVLFLGGFLFFLGFYQVTHYYQNRIDLKPALMVAFFIAGLIIHGSLQAWWIAPILGNLPELGLNLMSIFLTAFNDNAAITYLATLVTDFPDQMKYAVVSGAVVGGGLTVIANSPNPIGQSVLKQYFGHSISAGSLLKYALLPTAIATVIFYLF
jgi:Na+/H+ antiporter NhaD/arsenite permease-like protein